MRLSVVCFLIYHFAFLISSHAQPVLTVNGLNANYTTTHLFVDEVVGDAVSLTVLFTPNAANLTQVEFFSNLNRRDRAIARPPMLMATASKTEFVHRAATLSSRERTRITLRLTR